MSWIVAVILHAISTNLRLEAITIQQSKIILNAIFVVTNHGSQFSDVKASNVSGYVCRTTPWIGLLHIPWLYFLVFRTGFLKASCWRSLKVTDKSNLITNLHLD